MEKYAEIMNLLHVKCMLKGSCDLLILFIYLNLKIVIVSLKKPGLDVLSNSQRKLAAEMGYPKYMGIKLRKEIGKFRLPSFVTF